MSEIAAMIVTAAGNAGVDPGLALAVAERESGLNQAARGAAGEIGIFQLMPATAADLGVNPYDIVGNIDGGTRYLAQMLARFGGDVAKGIAANNAGAKRVSDAVAGAGDGWFSAIPASTQGYVADVMAAAGYSPGGDGTQPQYDAFLLSDMPAPASGAVSAPDHSQMLIAVLVLAGIAFAGLSYASAD